MEEDRLSDIDETLKDRQFLTRTNPNVGKIEGYCRILVINKIDENIGKAFILNLKSISKPTIELSDLEQHQNRIRNSEFILLYTGWSRLWGKETYFQGYPVLSLEAAQWLSNFELKGLGTDMISVDEAGSSEFPIHRILLARNIIIIENLTNLQSLPNIDFIFSCFPLKIKQADGSPVRAMAIIT